MNKSKHFFQSVLFSVILILFTGAASYGQKGSLGFGVRLGDPTGLSIKKYLSNSKALEFSIGRSYYIWNRGNYYENGFYRVDKFKDKNYYKYYGYKGYTPIGMQLHIMLQKPIAEIKGLDVYYGLGPQFRYEHIEYGYYYTNRLYYENYNDIDLGIDGVLGLEYTLSDVPLSVFMDVTLFMEVLDDPFLPMFQAGLGLRYNFNAGGGGSNKSGKGNRKK